jgi:hypothetical protein
MIDHCLDVLREGIMCNADMAINTLVWKTPTFGMQTGCAVFSWVLGLAIFIEPLVVVRKGHFSLQSTAGIDDITWTIAV